MTAPVNAIVERLMTIRITRSLTLEETARMTAEKQAIRFKADIPHSYHNPFDKECAVYNVIFYPQH